MERGGQDFQVFIIGYMPVFVDVMKSKRRTRN